MYNNNNNIVYIKKECDLDSPNPIGVNFNQDNVLIYGGAGRGKSTFIEKLILGNHIIKNVYFMNDCPAEVNNKIFKDVDDSFQILKYYDSVNYCLQRMINGCTINCTLIIDSEYPYCREHDTYNLIKEFLTIENKNGNNLILTAYNKSHYDSFEFDSYLNCGIDFETGARFIKKEVIA